MKKMLLLLAAAAALVSCQTTDPAPSNPLLGKWQWVKSTGGIAGTTILADSSNASVIQFGNDSSFVFSRTGFDTITSTYSISNGTSITSTDLEPLITVANASFKWSFAVTESELVLFDQVYDGYTHNYVRVP
ncbi:hypothetical protein [Jiulongibacter sp. NS-SX5]|uniref:hypothetical protein n=1 Tax=Jiulongibacter sp. NS-SX5 TaxID=3463854 RepID=UPI004059442E